jgi:hypothetical protein
MDKDIDLNADTYAVTDTDTNMDSDTITDNFQYLP